MAGAAYHQDELSILTVALRPPAQMSDLNRGVKAVFRKLEAMYEYDIEYRAAWVWENNHPHAHILATLPYVKQQWLYETLEEITGYSTHVWINQIYVGDSLARKRAVSYLAQYMASQKSDSRVNYSQSRGWLPPGYENEWTAVKARFKALYGPNAFEVPEWRQMAVAVIEQWIEDQYQVRLQRKVSDKPYVRRHP